MRLDVGVLGAEEGLGAVDGELLDLVDHLASAVVALPRQSLGVLVGQGRPGRLEHRLGDEVLAGDQLQPVGLPRRFLPDQLRDFGVHGGQRFLERIHLVSLGVGLGSYHNRWGQRRPRRARRARRVVLSKTKSRRAPRALRETLPVLIAVDCGGQSRMRWKAITALVPPKPNELDKADSMRTSRARFGT